MANFKAAEIDFLFDLTADAYSRPRYTAAGWRGSIVRMGRAGYSSRQAEAVLRSKHMRWASDYANRNGSTTAANFEAYWAHTFGGFNTPKAAKEIEALRPVDADNPKIPVVAVATLDGNYLAGYCEGEDVAALIDLARSLAAGPPAPGQPDRHLGRRAKDILALIDSRAEAGR